MFDQARQDGETRRQLLELRRLAQLPNKRVRYEEQGSIRLPQNVFRDLNRPAPAYLVTTLGVLTLTLLCLENAAVPPTIPRGRIEGNGDDSVLVLDKTFGFGTALADELDWKYEIEHLAAVGWLTLAKSGSEWRIGRGVRAMAALRKAS